LRGVGKAWVIHFLYHSLKGVSCELGSHLIISLPNTPLFNLKEKKC